MGDFEDQLKEDANQYTAIAGVSMTYKPAAGGTRAITGVILYDGTSELPGVDVNSLTFVISVENDSTTGISSDEFTEGGLDKITIAPRISMTATDRPIMKIVSEDNGMIQLGIG